MKDIDDFFLGIPNVDKSVVRSDAAAELDRLTRTKKPSSVSVPPVVSPIETNSTTSSSEC